MKQIIKDVQAVIGSNQRLIIGPFFLAIVDAFLNMLFFSIMILSIVKLVDKSFDRYFFQMGLIVLILVFITRILLSRYTYNSMQINGSIIVTKLRIQLAEHVRSLNSGYFNQNSIGKLISHFTTDIADFEQILTHNFTDFVKAVFTILIGMIAALFIDFKFAFIMAVMIIIALPLLLKGGQKGTQIASGHHDKINNVISRVVEYINGIKTFRLYQLTGTKFKRLDQSFNELRKSSIKVELSMMPYVMSFSTIVSFIIPVALVWGTNLLIHGDTTPEKFIAVLILSVSISSQLIAVGMLYPEMKFMAKSASNLKQVLAEKTLPYNKETLELTNRNIDLQQVDFSYDNEVPILKTIDLSVKDGQTVALIGPSGSGKSTIIHLISRFWGVKSGKIEIGGVDISTVKPDALTEQISCVFQEVYLFNDSILANIQIGKPNATIEEVQLACQKANCHEFIIQLEDGYDTVIGEGGSTLSGGEKQRISIARAILKDAPIILLDETTSSLDADNEIEINRALDELMINKTVVVIAHRLNTIINADQIVVLEEGKIIEQGNHKQLLVKNGWYAQMYSEQQKARKWVV